MPLNTIRTCGARFILAAILTGAAVQAQSAPLLSEVHTIAASTTGVPVEHEFTITTAGAYQVTLTDLGAAFNPPAPLASLKLAVTSNGALVGTPLTGAGTLQFNATTAGGTYQLHVVGAPGSVAGSGPIGIQVGTSSSPASIATYSDNIALAQQALPSSEAIINDSFTVANGGSFVVTLTDLAVPQSLGTLTLALTPEGGAPIQILPDPNNSGAMQATVNLQSGTTYQIAAVGKATSIASAGLFSAAVTPSGGGTPIYGMTVPIGGTVAVGSPTLTAGNHTLTLADLKYPAALAQFGATVTQNGQSVAQLSGAGSQSFTATAGTYQVFGVATPQTNAPAAGSYTLQVAPQGGAPELAIARAVTPSGGTLSAYSFDTNIASSAAGSVVVGLQNFPFPVSLVSVSLAAVQNGVLLGTPLTAPGNLTVTTAAGPITFLVLAQADPVQGGLFDVNLTPSGATAPSFDVAQGVTGTSKAFISRKFTVTGAGNYDVVASDLGFPSPFANFAVMVTQGSNNVGSIFSTDKLTINATPGDYFINVLAQPAATDKAGTFALSVAPPAPTVSLKASATQVEQGGTVTLTWSSQNASSCTASNGWTGTQQLTGSATSAALTATTTFVLTCNGAGGSNAASVTVTVNAAQSSSKGGGGGKLDGLLLVVLAAVGTLRLLASGPARQLR